jgi:prolyl oligopeptidase
MFAAQHSSFLLETRMTRHASITSAAVHAWGRPRLAPHGFLFALALAPALAASVAAHAAAVLAYPETRRADVVDDYHGTAVADPYRWLEDADSPETAAWVAAQNELSSRYLESIPERAWIRERLTKLWDYPKHGVPSREGDWYVWSKNDGLQNQSVIYKQRSLDDEPTVLIDPNALSADGTVAISTMNFSLDGRYMAYGVSTAGSDWIQMRVREVASGKDLDDRLDFIKFSSAAWTLDGRGFFYSRYPRPEGNALTSTNRNHTLYYHALGTEQSADRLVHARPDKPEWGIEAQVSEDGRYVVFDLEEGTDRRNRTHYIDLVDPMAPRLDGPVVPLLDGFDASYAFVGNDGPIFYFLTDLDAPRGRLIAIDTARPDRTAWKTLVGETTDVLTGVSLVNGQFIAKLLRDARSVVRVLAKDGTPVREVEFPTLGTAYGFGGKAAETETFYMFTSFLHAPAIYHYDMTTGTSTLLRSPGVDFDPSAYVTEQVFYTSKDGTRVPMFLVHKKGLVRDGQNPTLLYGYGGFNISLTPTFSASRLVWLEMGGVHAIANLRGGGEYGEAWHKAGMKERRQNVFDDFIAAAEHLIAERYTSPSRLAITGRSNGGLLVGAVLNQRPDLFAAALPGVGVMDMLRFHKFTIGYAWRSDYGSSEDPEGFRTLYAYSPLHNIVPGTKYPATLVTTADHDDRVVPGHSFKYAAALQAAQAGDAPALIRIYTSAGHGAGKPTTKLIDEAADEWAFYVKSLGMTVPASLVGATGASTHAAPQ